MCLRGLEKPMMIAAALAGAATAVGRFSPRIEHPRLGQRALAARGCAIQCAVDASSQAQGSDPAEPLALMPARD
jgi:uncharacterized metal-binding protein